ncbi:hypothetical protein ABIA39_006074 [Nocardia sp. GAS34]|uniref:hypothetical protein n=1 Tax=unclassified Nocardia TaxID=2637762 RepID=UPI003D1B4B19
MSAVQALQQARDLIDQARWLPKFLPHAIDVALAPPALAGAPAQIAGSPLGEGGMADIYRTVSRNAVGAGANLQAVADTQLPAAWRGQAAETMSEAVRAVAVQSAAAGAAFDSGYQALTAWARALAEAQRRDTQGRELLGQAMTQAAGPGGSPESNARFPNPATQALGENMWGLADEGCKERLAAATIVQGAASDAVDMLNRVAATARARQIKSPGIDPLTSVALAYSPEPGWSKDPLTAIPGFAALARLSQTLTTELDQLTTGGWSIAYGPTGKGSYTDRQSKKIVIDGGLFDNPVATVEALAHEAGHASYHGPIGGANPTDCVNNSLTDEGAATLNNMVVAREIDDKHGLDIGVAGQSPDVQTAWNSTYDAYRKAGSTPEAYQHAIQQIGAYYGEHLHPSTAPNETYDQYYQAGCQ